MANLRTFITVVLVLVVGVAAIGILSGGEDQGEPEGLIPVVEEELEQGESKDEPEIDRLSKIPSDAVKMTPDNDSYQPVLHSPLWEEPVPLPYAINTAGGEDSPFITPNGETLYFFFTPDVSVPAEKQLIDGVTGIYYSNRSGGGWSEAKRLKLGEDGVALDGCPYVQNDEIWFCSARLGNYRSVDFWSARLDDGSATDIRNVGERLNEEIGVGELHVTSDGSQIYFHSDMPGGKGGRDIWVVERTEDGWSDPVNVETVNSEVSDSLPFVTEEIDELWFTRWYMGYPAVYRSMLVEGGWGEPDLIVSIFAAEPSLDEEGNIYFAHHFIQEGVMLDADIYVAYRKQPVTPVDMTTPRRGFYMGILPMPAEGQSFEESHAMAAEADEIVPVWGRPTPFWEYPDDLSGFYGETFVEELIRGNGMTPLVHLSFIDAGMTLKTPPEMDDATLSSPEWRYAYREAVIDVVRAAKPRFLSVGNEVNRWYEEYGMEGENGFTHWVSLYEEIYDDVKEISPETFVFCTFSREIVSENREAELGVLNLFNTDKMNILVFTSYPHSVQGINSPGDIPIDYYSEAADYMPGKLFGFSEIAWPSIEFLGGEQGQADFIERVVGSLTVDQGIDLELVMWPWLHDLDESDETGLVRRDGSEKLGYLKWLEVSQGK